MKIEQFNNLKTQEIKQKQKKELNKITGSTAKFLACNLLNSSYRVSHILSNAPPPKIYEVYFSAPQAQNAYHSAIRAASNELAATNKIATNIIQGFNNQLHILPLIGKHIQKKQNIKYLDRLITDINKKVNGKDLITTLKKYPSLSAAMALNPYIFDEVKSIATIKKDQQIAQNLEQTINEKLNIFNINYEFEVRQRKVNSNIAIAIAISSVSLVTPVIIAAPAIIPIAIGLGAAHGFIKGKFEARDSLKQAYEQANSALDDKSPNTNQQETQQNYVHVPASKQYASINNLNADNTAVFYKNNKTKINTSPISSSSSEQLQAVTV